MKSSTSIVIGLTCGINSETGTYSLNQEYVNAVLDLGATPVPIIPSESTPHCVEEVLSKVDGLILTGGGDIDPILYGQAPHESLYDVNQRRDRLEIALARSACEMHLPVLGICRGMQVLNVAFGGTLIQDLAAANQAKGDNGVASRVDGRGGHFQEKPYARTTHSVTLCREGGMLASMYAKHAGTRHLAVNSMHHQAIDVTAPPFAVAARCGGVIEAIEKRDADFCLGVQWHPEYLLTGRVLFEGLVNAARNRKRAASEAIIGR